MSECEHDFMAYGTDIECRKCKIELTALDLINEYEEIKKERDELLRSKDFMEYRINQLQKEQSRFRKPERIMLCDILANGSLDHAVRDYPEREGE